MRARTWPYAAICLAAGVFSLGVVPMAFVACTGGLTTRPETPLPPPPPCAARPAPVRAHWHAVGPPACPAALVCLTPADAEALVGEVEDRRRWDATR